MSDHTLRRCVLVVLLFLAAGSPAAALERRSVSVSCRVTQHPAAYADASPLVLADVWSLGNVLSGGGRTRVVQICVAAMCLALFIMTRKLNG